MGDVSALKVAIELVHVPSKVRHVRSGVLPDGVETLLAIAADDVAAQSEGAELTGRPREVLKAASAFFIEQILLAPGSDSYRVLGARDDATNADLRRNMALLLKALHPDIDENKERAVFAGRVTRAWEDVKTPERREAYDRERSLSPAGDGARRTSNPSRAARIKKPATRLVAANVAAVARRQQDGRRARAGLVRRALSFFLGRNK